MDFEVSTPKLSKFKLEKKVSKMDTLETTPSMRSRSNHSL